MKKLILTLILSFFVIPLSHAGDKQIFVPPGTDYNNTGENVRNFLKQQSFATTNKIPVGTVEISIVHPDYLEADQFALLMRKTDMMTGCFEYTPIEYEANYIENYYLDVEVKHYRRTLIEKQNPSDCSTTGQVISGMIVLSVQDLASRGVRQLRFSNGNARDIYNVTVTENSVRLTPESMVAFKATGLQGPDKTYIEYQYGGNTIVALQVPMAHADEDISTAIHELAGRNALHPIEGRNDMQSSANVFYFTDPQGSTAEQIGENGYTDFGKIQVIRPYDGPEGRIGLPMDLKVFLTRPDITL